MRPHPNPNPNPHPNPNANPSQAYTRRGPNTEALKSALYKPMSLVLARKNLELEIEPTRVHATVL